MDAKIGRRAERDPRPMHNFSGPSRLPRYPGVGDCCGYLVSSWWQPRRRLTQLMAVTVPAVALAPQSPTRFAGEAAGWPTAALPRVSGCFEVVAVAALAGPGSLRGTHRSSRRLCGTSMSLCCAVGCGRSSHRDGGLKVPPDFGNVPGSPGPCSCFGIWNCRCWSRPLTLHNRRNPARRGFRPTIVGFLFEKHRRSAAATREPKVTLSSKGSEAGAVNCNGRQCGP